MTDGNPFDADTSPSDQPCPNCNGEGYVIVRVYPWDGCSYDSAPCKFCNPEKDEAELTGQSSMDIDFPF